MLGRKRENMENLLAGLQLSDLIKKYINFSYKIIRKWIFYLHKTTDFSIHVAIYL